MERCTIIGMLNDYDHTDLVSISDLYNAIQDRLCLYNIKQYCDLRYSTNLTRFWYDPYHGTPINWKEVKQELLKIDKEHKKKIYKDL